MYSFNYFQLSGGDRMTFGVKLKKYRKENGLSQLEVAEQLHISRQTLSKWELDKSFPDFLSLKQLAVIYDFSLDEIFDLQKAKENSLYSYTFEELYEAFIQKISKQEIDPIKKEFVVTEILKPLFNEIVRSAHIFWFSIEKRATSTFLSKSAETPQAKKFLELFGNHLNVLWFVTSQGIINCNIIAFLDHSTFLYYPFSDMEYVCLGRHYDALRIKSFNPPCIGVFTKAKTFNWGIISEGDQVRFSHVMTCLRNGEYSYTELEDFGMLQFIKKWRRKNLVKMRL